MKVALPTSVPMIPKVECTSVFVSFDAVVDRFGFREAVADKRRKGAIVAHFGWCASGADVVVGWNHGMMKPLRHLEGLRKGVMLYPTEEFVYKWFQPYMDAAADPDIDFLVVKCPSDSFIRVRFLSKLIAEGRFCSEKPHWLYGVPNPAELSVYKNLFSNFVASRFEVAVCSTCFLYSIFGVQLSQSSGVLEQIPGLYETRMQDLGMGPWMEYSMNREQARCFHMNADIVLGFASGNVGDEYHDRICAMLEEENIK